ncbi:MAG: fructose-6-phosphate aldolase [Ruminococcaceae bacterium]|nr:fructose-6-phosphate aldolase [Oscillospiraceae bacterium]
MMYIIDTANLDQIRKCVEFYPIAGVTTNPTIISRENTDFVKLIKDIRDIIGPDLMLHVQVTASKADDIVKEALLLKEAVGGNFYVKIPISQEGLKATSILHNMGMKVTETAIFTQQQALIAALAGADFVAPYVNRLDNIVSDGVQVVSEIVDMFKAHDIKTKVLAASFKTVEQIHKIAMSGCHSVTINPELFETLTYHPMTQYAIDDFNADWESVYGRKSIAQIFEGK